jgi:uncharacterized protein (TIGR02147 family)
MPDISQYSDYRKYLQDYYEEARKKNPGFSYQVFSEKAGIKSKGFLYNVVHGRRTLSKSHIFGLSQAMRLSRHESEYLENLVAFNESATLKERNYFYERLSSIKANGAQAWKKQIIRKEQFEYYSRLHYGVIRSLIDMHGFNGDYKALANMVRPRITPKQAKTAVELLEKLGFIQKQKNGVFKVSDKAIATEPEVVSLAVLNFHRQAAELGARALEELSKEQRNITGCMLGISKQTYGRICEEIRLFRARLLQIAEADAAADTVYQLNFQLFPVSVPPVQRKHV